MNFRNEGFQNISVFGNATSVKDFLGEKLFQSLVEKMDDSGTVIDELSTKKGDFQIIGNKLLQGHYCFSFNPTLDNSENGKNQVSTTSEEKSKDANSEIITDKLRKEVHEHKATQIKLAATQGYAQIVMDSLVNLIVTFDNKLRLTDVNRTVLEISGYDKRELLGRSIIDFIGEVEEIGKLKQAFIQENKFMGKVALRKKNGDLVRFYVSVSRIVNNQKENLGFVCSMRDITEIEDWREKLALVEERYTDLFENASDLIQGVNINQELRYVNKAWYSCLGYSKSERKKLKMDDLVIPEEKAAYLANFEKLINGEKTVPQMWRLKSKSGKIVILESSSDLKLIDGEVIAVRSIMRDLTNTREAERLVQNQSAKIEAIFEGSRILFWTVNRKTSLTSFNSQYAKVIFDLYGKYPEVVTDETSPKIKFASKDYHDFWELKYKEVLDTRKNVSFQTETTDLKGNTCYREIYLNPIWEGKHKDEIREIAGMAIDVTEKKLAEQKIVAQTAKISTIFNATPHMIWSIDTEGNLTTFNESFEVKMKERFGIAMKIGDPLSNLSIGQNEDALNRWKDGLQYVWEGNTLQFEMKYTDVFEKEHIEDVFIAPVYNEKGSIIEIAGLSQTITFKKTAEKKLRDQTAKISAIFDSTAMLIWTVDDKNRIVSYNKIFADNYFNLKGLDISIGNNFVDLIRDNLKDNPFKNLKRYYAAAFRGERQQFEGVLYDSEGKKMWMETFFNPIYSDNNEIKEVTCMSYEITDKKETEERMRETIREKEVLLQEVHHRVKNNLQVISSILNLQSSYVKDENSLKILRESQNRIKSMSFIHESLYHTGNFSNIEFSAYIYSLATNLIHSYSLESAHINLKTDFEKTSLSLDQAIPSGLIVNEILSNALKYAFKAGEEGEIYSSIKVIDGRVELIISDNGIGLPADFDYENSDSLGLQLIYTLIDQLNATIDVDTESGTKYFITFEKQ